MDVDGCSFDIEKVNKWEVAAIRFVFDRILWGELITSIWKLWNAKGILILFGNKWDGTTFCNMIKRPSLVGFVIYKGQVLEGVVGAWFVIVLEDKWRAV